MPDETKKKLETICGVNVLRFPPPLIAAVILLICMGINVVWPAPPDWTVKKPVLGLLLIILGFIPMNWAWHIFQSRATTLHPTGRATELVTQGPFRFTRNPIYLGLTIVLAGWALVLGTLPALFAPLVFMLVMNFVFIPFEERRLSTLFGQSYLDYKSRVRRWL